VVKLLDWFRNLFDMTPRRNKCGKRVSLGEFERRKCSKCVRRLDCWPVPRISYDPKEMMKNCKESIGEVLQFE